MPAIINEIKRNGDSHLIIEGHCRHHSNEFILAAVILRTDLCVRRTLKTTQLLGRQDKENIQAEILSDCGSYLLKKI